MSENKSGPAAKAREIAKEIVEHPDFPRYEYQDIEIIANALIAYGEAERKAGRDSALEDSCGCSDEVPCVLHFPMLEKAEREGYRRGLEEHMHDVTSCVKCLHLFDQGIISGKRVGLEEAHRIAGKLIDEELAARIRAKAGEGK